jgi:hypothetical protein
MRKQKSLKDPRAGFVECAYGDGGAQAAGKASRHLDCSYGAAFVAGTSRSISGSMNCWRRRSSMSLLKDGVRSSMRLSMAGRRCPGDLPVAGELILRQ